MHVQIYLRVYEAQLFLSLKKKTQKTFFGPCKAGHSLNAIASIFQRIQISIKFEPPLRFRTNLQPKYLEQL